MDERSAWTPGDLPEPAPDAGQTWSAPSAPGAAPYGGSSYAVPADPGYPTSSYPPPAVSPYSPPLASPYGQPAAGAAQFGTPAPQPFQAGPYGTPAQAPYGQPAFGAGPGYPPPDQSYGYAQPAGPYPYAVPQGNESLAVASMWVGIAAFLAPVVGPIVAISLGAVALGRIKRTGQRGRGMARWGIGLGIFWLAAPIAAAIVIPVVLNERNHSLHTACANGDMAACDSLFNHTADGSAEHSFADTCGGRTDGGYLCTSVGAVSYGDDKHLDGLWDACAAGALASCDELYYSSQPGSDYYEFGRTCGNRTDGSADCVDPLGDQTSST